MALSMNASGQIFYAQKLFASEELTEYLKFMVEVQHGIHQQVVYQSDTERTFAESLDKNEVVKVFAKLPSWFKVPTPLGAYNSDWAVLVEKDDNKRLYFIVETKSTLHTGDLRPIEEGKITCGEAHFKALAVHEPEVRYTVTRTIGDLMDKV